MHATGISSGKKHEKDMSGLFNNLLNNDGSMLSSDNQLTKKPFYSASDKKDEEESKNSESVECMEFG